MSIEEVDPVLGSSERNGQMAVPGWADEGRGYEGSEGAVGPARRDVKLLGVANLGES